MISHKPNSITGFLPIAGIILFIVMYILAAALYPGGNDADPGATGFSWAHNYWCELMAMHTKNGKYNPARAMAIPALFVLTISLGIFWWQSSRLLNRKYWLIRYPGIFSMASLVFLFWGPHDMVINIAAVLGLTAMGGVIFALYRDRASALFALGVFCLLLCLINNYIYYSWNFYYYLPIIQKISFVVFLIWFWLVTIHVNRRAGSTSTFFKQKNTVSENTAL